MQVKFLLFQCGNKSSNQGDALPLFLRATHEKSVMTIFLEFRRFFTERAAKTFAELQLSSSPGRVEIGETLSGEVFHPCKEFLELSYATSEIINHGGFGATASLL